MPRKLHPMLAALIKKPRAKPMPPTPEIPGDISRWPTYIPACDVVARIKYVGQPIGKERPRSGRGGHFYTPKATEAFEKALAGLWRAAVGFRPPEAGWVGIRCFIHRETMRRCDTDNILKAAQDSANGVAVKDDSQIVEVFGRMCLGAKVGGLEAVIYRLSA